jgi:hypothetical protein
MKKNLWGAREAGEAWGMSGQRVRLLCQQGRVPGAFLGIVKGLCLWLIPVQEKPKEEKRGRKANVRT